MSSASDRIGRAFRRLGTLVGIERTQAEDNTRLTKHGGDLHELNLRQTAFAADVESIVLQRENNIIR